MKTGFIKASYMAMTVTISALTLASCDYKDIEGGEILPGSEALDIDFDFSRVDSIPRSYTVMFYSLDEEGNALEGEVTRRDVVGRKTTVRVPPGDYAITAWNNDTHHVTVPGLNDRDSLYATTLTLDTRARNDPKTVIDSIFSGQRLYDYPDYMVHANVEEFTVNRNPAEQQTLTLQPDSMVITVNCHIGGVRGLAWCSRVKGAMSNVSGKRYIASHDRRENPVAVMFESSYDKDNDTLDGTFFIFGLSERIEPEATDRLVLFFWLPKTCFFYPIDISGQLERYRGKEVSHIDIIIEDLGIDLKDYLGGQGMFNLNVEDWHDIDIDIRM